MQEAVGDVVLRYVGYYGNSNLGDNGVRSLKYSGINNGYSVLAYIDIGRIDGMFKTDVHDEFDMNMQWDFIRAVPIKDETGEQKTEILFYERKYDG